MVNKIYRHLSKNLENYHWILNNIEDKTADAKISKTDLENDLGIHTY